MDKRWRSRITAAFLAVTVLVIAVMLSGTLHRTSHITLPSSEQAPGHAAVTGDALTVVEVTPETVQTAIATLSRPQEYRRTVTVDYFSAGQPVGTVTAQVWADGGWVRTSCALSSGTVEHTIVGEGRLWLWYDEGQAVYSGPAGRETADLTQRLPTYEDVLELDKGDITAARYEEREGQPCVYVEARTPLGYTERYWISVNSGLLAAAEMEKGEELIYSMSSHDVVSPLDQTEGVFVLPDGDTLYRSGE